MRMRFWSMPPPRTLKPVAPHQGGEFLDDGGVDPFKAHLGDLQFVTFALGEDRGGLEGLPVGFKQEVEFRGAADRHGFGGSLIAGERAEEGDFARADIEGIIADAVGDDADAAVFGENDGAGQRFAAGGVFDIAREDGLPALRPGGKRQEQEHGRREPGKKISGSHRNSLLREDLPQNLFQTGILPFAEKAVPLGLCVSNVIC